MTDQQNQDALELPRRLRGKFEIAPGPVLDEHRLELSAPAVAGALCDPSRRAGDARGGASHQALVRFPFPVSRFRFP
jgi:hypothetical protein